MGIYAIKPKFQQFLCPATRWFVIHRVHPTWINAGGLALSAGAGLALYVSYWSIWLLAAVPPLVLVRIALNALDGLVSRKLGLASRFGEVLNEFFDRLSDVFVFLGLALNPASNIYFGTIVTIAILLSSYLGTVSKAAGGSRQYGGFMGKADRMIYLGLMSLFVLISSNQYSWNYFLVFVLAGTFLTIFQRFARIKEELS